MVKWCGAVKMDDVAVKKSRSMSELLAYVGTSDVRRDFRCRETEKQLNLHSLYHVGQKYDGH